MAVRPLIGFNAAQPGNLTNLGDYVRGLDAAGIPAVIMGVGGSWGDIEGCWNNGSTVPHVACVRYMPPGGGQDVPPYGTDINTAVSQWLDWYIPLIGNDVKRYPQRVITKHGNELNKDQIVWLCEFYKALHPELLRRMGWQSHRICCFSFASGEPEPEHWEQPVVLDFLRLAGENPDKWVVGLHEYSYTTSAIFSKKVNNQFVPMQPGDPYTLVGRFTKLYEICDRHHIPRPHVLIHEFGWEMARIPAINTAMQHIAQAAALYAQYPTVLGEGTWTLKDYHGIQNQVQPLILPVRDFTLTNTFPDPTPPPDPQPEPDDGRGQPRVQYHRRYVLLPGSAGPEWATAVAEASYGQTPVGDFTVGKSADDAGIGDLERRTVIVVNPEEWE